MIQLDASWWTVVLTGFVAAAVTDLIRTALWATPLRGKKPISCDTCMSWWLCLLLSWTFNGTWPVRIFCAVGAAGCAITILAAQRYLRGDAGAPPQLPPL